MGTIVIGFDGSEPALSALEAGVEEAQLRGDDVMVVSGWLDPVFGVPPIGGAYLDPDQLQEQIGAELRAVVARYAKTHPTVPFRIELRHRTPLQVITEAVAETKAVMVVVGSRGRGGFTSLLFGSTSRAVVAESRVPVMVVREPADAGGAVVVGFDGTTDGRRALRWAADEAARRGVPLRPVMAWSYYAPQGRHGPEEMRTLYDQYEAGDVARWILGDELGPEVLATVEVEVPNELAAKALVEHQAGAGLLVVGPRLGSTHHRIDSGSVTLEVLHHSTCPVVVVPPA